MGTKKYDCIPGLLKLSKAILKLVPALQAVIPSTAMIKGLSESTPFVYPKHLVDWVFPPILVNPTK